MTTEVVTAAAPSNESSNEMVSNAKEEEPPMRRVPKELDILPPRPVLFPWLPSVDALKNCCGTASSTTKPNQSKRFSFDLSMGGKTFGNGALQPGTPVTAPLSPNSVDNDADDDGMPDMSRMEEGTANRKHRPRQQQQQQQQLGSLTDVIAEVLRVIFYLMSVKRAFLRNEAEGAQQKLPLHRKTADKSTTSSNSSNNADDEQIPRLSLSST